MSRRRRWYHDPSFHSSLYLRPSIVIGFWILVAVLFLVAIISLAAASAYKECHSRGRELGLSTDWDFWAGCFYELPSGRTTQHPESRPIELSEAEDR